MVASYRSIDYSIRPAKHAERRMLGEAFRRLSKFAAVESYQYVGMGSVWFSDFTHFHRSLGISRMISIEREKNHKERFEFNKPFGGVDLRFGATSAELPKIDWSFRTIAWLDYDDPLALSMLADIRTIAVKACSGSVLIVSIQCESRPTVIDTEDDEIGKQRPVHDIDELKAVYGAGHVSSAANELDLRGWRLAKLIRSMILSEITEALSAINISRPPQQHIEFRQIMAFDYEDGAKMMTIGGVFVDKDQSAIFASCGFDELDFYRSGIESVRLDVPILTPKEMRDLETRLPLTPGTTIQPGCMPQSDASAYGRLYRYLPSFASFEP